MFEVTWFNSEAEIPAELWAICFPPPLEGQWWYQALEHCGIEDQFTFRYGVVYARSEPVAIAPVFLMDLPIRLIVPPGLLPIVNLLGKLAPRILYQKTLFIGSPCADEGTLGVIPGVDQLKVLRCVNRSVRPLAHSFNAPLQVWKDFPTSANEGLAELARLEGLFPLVSFPGTVVGLPGPRKEDYFASLKASRRNKLKKKLRLIAESVPIDIEILHAPTADTLDEIFALFWQTYEKGTTKFERLNRKFFELIATQPHSHFIVMRERASGDMVAFMLCFALCDRIINKFIGIDYRRPKVWFLYFRLWDAMLDWALLQGATSIQSGQTGYAPKIETGHQLVPLTNYCYHRNFLIRRIIAALAKTVNWDTLDDDLASYVRAYPEQKPNPLNSISE